MSISIPTPDFQGSESDWLILNQGLTQGQIIHRYTWGKEGHAIQTWPTRFTRVVHMMFSDKEQGGMSWKGRCKVIYYDIPIPCPL